MRKYKIIGEEIYKGRKRIKCECECGRIMSYLPYIFKKGISCTCNKSRFKIGDKVGKLKIFDIIRGNNNRLLTKCLCDCGTTLEVYMHRLGNRVTHCGCNKKPPLKRTNFGETAFKCIFGNYKNNAKNKNISFCLNEIEFRNLITNKCYYCGTEPKQIYDKKSINGAFIYNGIDRIDSLKGYELNNVRSCCKQCNYLKTNYSEKEFLTIIKNIYQNLKLNNYEF